MRTAKGWDCEGCLDPAVSVHEILRDSVDEATDRLAKELLRGHEEACRDQEDDGGSVVQLEDEVVGGHLIVLNELFHRDEKAQHFRV